MLWGARWGERGTQAWGGTPKPSSGHTPQRGPRQSEGTPKPTLGHILGGGDGHRGFRGHPKGHRSGGGEGGTQASGSTPPAPPRTVSGSPARTPAGASRTDGQKEQDRWRETEQSHGGPRPPCSDSPGPPTWGAETPPQGPGVGQKHRDTPPELGGRKHRDPRPRVGKDRDPPPPRSSEGRRAQSP